MEKDSMVLWPDEKLLSIIIPVYNTEAYLPFALETLGEEKGVEILLIDDGSAQPCAELCDLLASKNNSISVIHKPNGGLSSARNLGIREARGRYLLFLDSDDMILQEAYQKLLSSLREEGEKEGPELYLCTMAEFWQTKDEAGSLDLAKLQEETSATSLRQAFLAKLGQGQNQEKARLSAKELRSFVKKHEQSFFLIAPRFILKRSFVLEAKLFFKEGIYHEDEDFATRLLSLDLVSALVSPALYAYRRGRTGSITETVGKKHLTSRLIILEEQLSLYEALQDSEKKSFVASRLSHNLLSILMFYQFLSEEGRRKLKSKGRSLKDFMRVAEKKDLVRLSWTLLGSRLTAFLLRLWHNRLKIRPKV